MRVLVGAGAVVVLLAADVALAVVVLGHHGLAALDTGWRHGVITHRTPVATDVMVAASRFGSTPSLMVIAAVAAGWLWWRRQRRDAVFVVAAATGGLLLAPVLKPLFDRARPALSEHVVAVTSQSYPSGHSLGSFAVLGAITLLAARGRPWLFAVGAVLVAVVGFSRVYLGVHYPSDVLAGWLLAATWLTLCRLALGNSGRSGTVQASS